MKRDNDTGDRTSTAPDAQASDGEQPLAPWALYLILAAAFGSIVWFCAAQIFKSSIAIGAPLMGLVIGRVATMAVRATGRNYSLWALVVTLVSIMAVESVIGPASFVPWSLVIAALPPLYAARRRAAREALAIRDHDQRALFARDEPPPLASTARTTRLLCDRCRQLVDASIIERLNGEMVCTHCRAE